MTFKKKRNNRNIRECASSLKAVDFDILTNTEVIPLRDNGNILIWLDATISPNNSDDQYVINQLRSIIHSMVTFIEKQTCLKFIDQFRGKTKLFLIVSGSLGQTVVPEIEHQSRIHSIYVFCGNKLKHETWARRHQKVRGVFDDITDLCEYLNRDKQKLQIDQANEHFIDLFSKQPVSQREFNGSGRSENPSADAHQAADDVKAEVTAADIPFGEVESSPSEAEVELSDNIHASETVSPVVQYKQQMEFSDTGIWPCVSVIDSVRSEVVNYLHSVIGMVQYLNCIESFLHHVHNHHNDPHFVVVCNPTNVQQLVTLIHPRVRKVFIYCSDGDIKAYYTLSEKYPTIVSVMRHTDSLGRLILVELSVCIVDIGHYYDNDKKKSLAQARYRYAYRLHLMVREDLKNRIETIECNQSTRFSN